MSKERKVEIIQLMSEVFGRSMTPGAMALYTTVLDRFADDEVQRAAETLMQTEKFMPPPAAFVTALEGSPDDASLKAWNHALEVLAEVGTYQTVDFGDPRLHYAIDTVGGWPEFGMWDSDEKPFVEKRFREAYRAYRPGDSANRILLGIAGIGNAAEGHASPAVLDVSRDGMKRLRANTRQALQAAETPAAILAGNNQLPEELAHKMRGMWSMDRAVPV